VIFNGLVCQLRQSTTSYNQLKINTFFHWMELQASRNSELKVFKQILLVRRLVASYKKNVEPVVAGALGLE
jgi:hypothetical protein